MKKTKEVVVYQEGDRGIKGILKPVKSVGKLEELSDAKEENIQKVISKSLPDYILIWSFFNGSGKSYAYRDCEINISIGKAVRCENAIVAEVYVDYTKDIWIKYIYLVHSNQAHLICQTYANMGDSLNIRAVTKME